MEQIQGRRKPGVKPKPPAEVRSVRVTMLLTTEEYTQWQRMAQGEALTAWVRRMINSLSAELVK